MYVFTIILLGFGSSSAFGSSATGASSFGFGTTSKPSGSLSAGWFVCIELKNQFYFKASLIIKLLCSLKEIDCLKFHVCITINITTARDTFSDKFLGSVKGLLCRQY